MKRGAVMTQKAPFFKKLWKNMRSHPLLYIMILPVLAYFLVYHYYPMYGMIISLFDYVPTKGVFGSDFVGLKHFKAFLGDPYFFRTMRNTVSINLLLLLFGFPFPIIFAILLNELTGTRLRKSHRQLPICLILFPRWLSAALCWISAKPTALSPVYSPPLQARKPPICSATPPISSRCTC